MVAIGNEVVTNYLTTLLKYLLIAVILAPNLPSKFSIIYLSGLLI